jgi:hypothetical protein
MWNDTSRKIVVFGAKPIPVPFFSTTSPAWMRVGMNLDLHGKRVAWLQLEVRQKELVVTKFKVVPWYVPAVTEETH